MAINAPDVTPQPIPDVRVQSAASETTFGGGPGVEAEGQQIQKIVQDTGGIAAFETIRHNQMAVEEAQAKGLDLYNRTLFDRQTGVLGSQGKDALRAQGEGTTRFQKGLNDIAKTLNGDQQKGAFNKWALAQNNDFQRTVAQHVDKQLTAHDNATLDNLMSQLSAKAALNHGDPMAIKNAFGTAKDNVDGYIQRNRLDSDAADILRQKANDALHTAVIDGMSKFQMDDSAQKYFDAHKDDISPAAQEKLVVGLNEHNIRWKASSSAQGIIQGHPDSEADALAQADKIKNPEVQDAARKLISARFSEDRAAKKNDQDALFMQMSTMVNQKGLSDPIDRRNAVPPMAWTKLSAEQQRAIEKGGQPDVTSPSKWLDFRELVKNGTLQDLPRADLESKYLQYMSPADQKQAADQWSDAQKAGPKLKSAQSFVKMTDDALVEIGMMKADPKLRHEPQKRLALEFANNVDRDKVAQEVALGRALKPEEEIKLIDQHKLTLLGRQPLSLYERFISMPTVPFEKIPDQARAFAMNLARSVGGTASRANIEKAYELHRQGKSDDEIRRIFQ